MFLNLHHLTAMKIKLFLSDYEIISTRLLVRDFDMGTLVIKDIPKCVEKTKANQLVRICTLNVQDTKTKEESSFDVAFPSGVNMFDMFKEKKCDPRKEACEFGKFLF